MEPGLEVTGRNASAGGKGGGGYGKERDGAGGQAMTTTIPHPTANVSEIRDALSTFIAPGQVVEIRVPKKRSKGAVAGYFNNLQKAAEAAAYWSGKEGGVYLVLNPFNPALFNRACNRMEDGIATTQDADITRRRYIPVDVDCNGPAGISSTEEEHQAALNKVQEISKYLRSVGFPPDSLILADSGNGGHLPIAVDFPNDGPAKILVENFLKALDFRFSDDKTHVDTGMANAARIWKLYGTLAAKGDSTPDRPHRYSRLLSKPTTRVEAPRAFIELVAATLPQEPKKDPKFYHGNGKTFDLLAFIATHFPDTRGPLPWNGGQKWIITVCPFNESHDRGEAYIVQFPSGAIAAGCHHNSCQHWGWRELRAKFDTDYRNRSNGNERKPTDHVAVVGQTSNRKNSQGRWVSTLAEEIGKNNHFAQDDGGKLYRYHNGFYRRDGDAFVKGLVKHLMKDWEAAENWSSHLADETSEYLRVDAPQLWTQSPADTINVANGLLNINGDLRPHSYEFLSCIQLPVKFDSTATCPHWDAFIRDIFPDDSRQLGYEIPGDLVTCDHSIQKALLFIGEGGNGVFARCSHQQLALLFLPIQLSQ